MKRASGTFVLVSCIVSLASCVGPKTTATTMYWEDDRSIVVTVNFLRTDESRMNRDQNMELRCFVSGTIKNTSGATKEVASLSIVLKSASGAELATIQTSIHAGSLAPNQSTDFSGSDFVSRSLLTEFKDFSGRMSVKTP